MAVELGRRPLPAATPHVSFGRRLYGLGSIFGKTVRDSRLGAIAVAALLGGIIIAGGATMANTYATLEARRELAALSANLPPVLTGLYGNPVNVDTLGGFISWHYGAYFALLAGLWSILALSSTLAGEARRGSLEFAVATPLSRRRIALEKVAGHVLALVAVMALIGIATWVTGAGFARMPGDEIPPDAAIGFAIGLGLKALLAGAIAFALGSFVGRGAAAGVAGALMFAGYVVNSYRAVVPAFDSIAGASWFAWTADHVPLAGRSDWGAVAVVAVGCVVLLGVGVVAFARRDVGVTSSIQAPAMPRALLGVGGPLGRSFGELLPTGLAWGIGLGLYGLVMSAASRSLVDEIARAPSLVEVVRNIVPGIDMTTPAGFLQLLFVDFGLLLVGLAAATFVAGRSGDETAGRLELQLVTPLTRFRWAFASGVAIWLAIGLVIILLAGAIGVGVVAAGGDALEPVVGTLALALYGVALAGIGLAVGGLVGPSLAAPVVVIVAIGTFLVDVLAPALNLPDWVHQAALSAHMGQPMVGTWDAAGIAACLGLAIGGLVLGAWGMGRRDVSG